MTRIIHRKFCLVLISLLCLSYAQGQEWNTLEYNPDQPGLEENPLKGFADLYGPSNDFPRSINGRLFGLNQVMFGLDQFNWDVIDEFIEQNKREGNFTYLQVNIDPGPDGNNRPRSYMPAFLNGQYESVMVEGPVADICPDWNDPEVLEAMVNFIKAFGARYDESPEVYMVVLGLYGIYGEWQIGDAANLRPDFEMTQENRLMIANTFKQSFPNTNLLARYPEHMPEPELFGYSDGLYFTQSISSNTFFNHFYFNNTINLYNAGQNWRSQVIGGEIDPCVQPLLWKNWPNTSNISCDPNNPSGTSVDVQDVTRTIMATHPSVLFTHYVFTDLDRDSNPAEWNNAIRAQKLMGYTFHVDQYRLSAKDGLPIVEVNIQNKGVSPMYANWDIEVGVINKTNNAFQSLGIQNWNLNLIQPDDPSNYRSFISDQAIDDGDYTLMIRVINPLSSESAAAKPLRFANTTQDINDMEGWLTLGDISIVGGLSGEVPVSVEGVTISPENTTISVGKQLQLSAQVSPANATETNLTWTSNKPGTASVNRSGLVSAGPAFGEVVITAYTQDGGLVSRSTINVLPISVTVPAFIEAEDYVRMNGIIPGFGKLGFIDDGDWMDYNITVPQRANYIIDIYASCPNCIDNQNEQQDIGILEVRDETGNILDEVRLPKTNSFDSFEIAPTKSLRLEEGTYNLRFQAKKGAFDVDRIRFKIDETTSTAEIANNSKLFHIYPNPTPDVVQIQIEDSSLNPSDLSMHIYNVYGGIISSLELKNGLIDLSSVSAGVYFLAIEYNGQRAVKKVIKY